MSSKPRFLKKALSPFCLLFSHPLSFIYLRKPSWAFALLELRRRDRSLVSGARFQPRAWSHLASPLVPSGSGGAAGPGWGRVRGQSHMSFKPGIGGSGAGAEAKGQRSSAAPDTSFSLLPFSLARLSLPLFPSPSIPLSPSAPPAACQLPADDISFHVWG